MNKLLSIVLLMAFTLSGYAVAAPYSPAQGEALYLMPTSTCMACVDDLDALRPSNDGRMLLLPEAVTDQPRMIAGPIGLMASEVGSGSMDSAYIFGGKAEVGWRSTEIKPGV